MKTSPISSAINRRLTAGKGLPVPEIVPSPEPETRLPTPETPASDISAKPIVDIKKYTEGLDTKQESTPVRDAIARALTGFSRGFAATPKEATYSPIAGGIAGGLIGTGQGFEEDARLKLAADEPRRALVKMIIDKQAEQAVKEPYDQAKEAREQAGREKLLKLRGEQAQKSSELEAARRGKEMGLNPTDYLKFKDKASTEALLRGKLPGDPEYDALVETIMREDAEKARGFGATKVKVPPKAPASPAPKAAPRTADDYLKGK